AIVLLTVAKCRSFKGAQAMATYPVLLMMFLPMIGMIPGIEQTWWIWAVPMGNYIAAMKHEHTEVQQLLALAVLMVYTGLALAAATRLFFSESELLAEKAGKVARAEAV